MNIEEEALGTAMWCDWEDLQLQLEDIEGERERERERERENEMQLHDRRESMFRGKEDRNKTEGGEVICWMEGWDLNTIGWFYFCIIKQIEIATVKILLSLNAHLIASKLMVRPQCNIILIQSFIMFLVLYAGVHISGKIIINVLCKYVQNAHLHTDMADSC